jgi:hypothetical protein
MGWTRIMTWRTIDMEPSKYLLILMQLELEDVQGGDLLKRGHLKRDETAQQQHFSLLPQDTLDSKNKSEGASFHSIDDYDASSIEYSKYVAAATDCLEDLCKEMQSDLQDAKIETGKLFTDDQDSVRTNNQDEEVYL